MSERAEAAIPSGSPPRARPGLRLLNALLFGIFAAIGFGLVSRPALLYARSLGLFAPTLPWDVPLGRLFLALALGLSFETIRLGVAVTSGARLRALDRLPLLLLVLGALGARVPAGEPLAPFSAVPRLVTALRTTADALDRGYGDPMRYGRPAAELEQALAPLGPSYFVYRGHDLPLRARILEDTKVAQATPLAGDLPGTIYVALSADKARAFITALTLDASGKPDILRAPNGRPLVIESHAGTHSAPGRDPLVPEYPGMQHAFGEKKPN